MADRVRRLIKGVPVLVVLLAASPDSHGLDVHLQALPPAPGLRPSQGLDPLAGVKEALNCGLAFLDGAKACGLTGVEQASSPFSVTFDPMFCRLSMRFDVGQLIDGLLNDWISGALARIGTPKVGLLCLLGIGPQFCGAARSSLMMSPAPAVPQSALLQKMSPEATKAAARQQQAVRETLDAALRDQGRPATAGQNGAAPAPAAPQTAPKPEDGQESEKTGLENLLR
ncbi:MAG: hypothetical protein JNM60_09590 [Candidatus Competibacteraceae bacterium]|nr:hypothetical protein [Candidatus Competibacteraceae bacterium]